MAVSADDVRVKGDTMDLGRGPMKVFSTYDPAELDWEGCDVVLECTGKFNSRDAAAVHLGRGARRVLVSAPAKNADKTIVYGVNHRELLDTTTSSPTAPARRTASRRSPRC
jgi:glyceraldehyde 3-phosphate dehydrogenase